MKKAPIRIINTRFGFISQILIKNGFFFKTKWVGYVTYFGTDEPYPFTTFDACKQEAVRQFEANLLLSQS